MPPKKTVFHKFHLGITIAKQNNFEGFFPFDNCPIAFENNSIIPVLDAFILLYYLNLCRYYTRFYAVPGKDTKYSYFSQLCFFLISVCTYNDIFSHSLIHYNIDINVLLLSMIFLYLHLLL